MPRAHRLLLASTLLLILGLAAPLPAQADTRRMPGHFTGYAFDTCDTPSQRAMNRWRTHSKFWGAGIYIAGMNRACSSQPHLTKKWVRTQARKGWHLLPLVVGRQASCAPQGLYRGQRIASNPHRSYRKARLQGRRAAASGAVNARRLGIGRHSVIWFDLEHFDIRKNRCRRSALAFTSAWTKTLHDRGFRSGFYSSAASGIRMLDDARRRTPKKYELPDYLWIAEWNGRASLKSGYIPKRGWWPDRRVHQYRGGHNERHGGVRLNIDSDFMSARQGTRPSPVAPHCKTRISFAKYPTIERGDRGRLVAAAQCLLRQDKKLKGKITGRFDRSTARAVRRFQRSHDKALPVNGNVGRSTWTLLLTEGKHPLLKFGAGGNAVRRLQRGLNAASGARLRVDGVFSRADLRAVKQYQRRTNRPRTGVVAGRTWKALRNGRFVKHWSHRSGAPGSSDLNAAPWWVIPYGSGVTPPEEAPANLER